MCVYVCDLLTWLVGACTAARVSHASWRWKITCVFTPVNVRLCAMRAVSRTSTPPGCGNMSHAHTVVWHPAADWARTPPPLTVYQGQQSRFVLNNSDSRMAHTLARFDVFHLFVFWFITELPLVWNTSASVYWRAIDSLKYLENVERSPSYR